MNYTESFDQFASRMTPTDLALYAGAAIVLWVLFKDRMSPVQKFLTDTYSKVLSLIGKKENLVVSSSTLSKTDDIFFALVQSWKQTRDLAVKSGCVEAVKVADQMFPFLSPNVCGKDNQV
jgi:hypothetical protein